MHNSMRLPITLLACVATTVSAVDYTFTNSLLTNDFSNWGNWTPAPTAWTGGHNWIVNSAGPNRAELTSALSVQRNVLVGDTVAGSTGEFLIGTGGNLSIERALRLGRNGGATTSGTVTVDGGGILTIGYEMYLGQNLNAGSVFNLVNGTVTISNNNNQGISLNVAHQTDGNGTLNISGGQMIVNSGSAVFSDSSTGVGTSALNLSGAGMLTLTTGNISFAGNNGGVSSAVSVADTSALTASSVRFGFGTNSNASLTMVGGSINATTSFITMGQGAGSVVNATISGGAINTDRLIWANEATATATLTMTGGTFNIAKAPDSTSVSSGGLVLGAGAASLSIGGDAEINIEKLRISDGGMITLHGDARMVIAGSTDGTNATFDFSTAYLNADWSAVLGRLVYNGGVFEVAGEVDPVFGELSYATLLNTAVANGVIYTEMVGMSVVAQYDSIGNVTQLALVPEPAQWAAILGLAALGGMLLRRRRVSR
jgi:hypothetical protein